MADPDAASAALIAKLLQEENPYGEDVYGYQDDSDDEDYGRAKRKKKKKPVKPPKAPKPPKEHKPPKEPKAPKEPKRPREPTGDEEFTETGRRKRKDAGTARAKARPWDDQEEVKFREALVLYGRDWKKCAEHVGTKRGMTAGVTSAPARVSATVADGAAAPPSHGAHVVAAGGAAASTWRANASASASAASADASQYVAGALRSMETLPTCARWPHARTTSTSSLATPSTTSSCSFTLRARSCTIKSDHSLTASPRLSRSTARRR